MVRPGITADLRARLVELLEDLQPRRPPFILHLANLRLNRINITRAGDDARISANIANVGTRDAGAFDIMTTWTRNGQAGGPVFHRVNRLPMGTARTVELALLPNLSDIRAELICAQVWLDPPTANKPAGEILESNNEDNFDEECLGFLPHVIDRN